MKRMAVILLTLMLTGCLSSGPVVDDEMTSRDSYQVEVDAGETIHVRLEVTSWDRDIYGENARIQISNPNLGQVVNETTSNVVTEVNHTARTNGNYDIVISQVEHADVRVEILE